MRKILVCSIFCSFIFADNLEILQNDKKEFRNLEKEIIQKKYEEKKNDWIGTVNLSSGLTRSHAFSKENDAFNKSISIGFSQSIYESGGIEFGIKYAKDELNSELIAWENENIAILQIIYETLLFIKKLKFQIEQSDYALKNKDIELILKKIQYEAGRVDIIDLNNEIM